MADLESFSASMVELEKEMAELDQQLSVEKQTARTLQSSASTSAKKREDLSREICTMISELCELEMEAEDLTSLQPQEHSIPSVARPGQKGATDETRSAMHAACDEFVAACRTFKDRHSSLHRNAAAAEALGRSLDMSRKMSEARAALASAKERLSSTQEQLSTVIDACDRVWANSEEVRARLKGEAERGARLQDEHERLEREQRKALEEAERELCASTLQDEAAMELQKELRNLNQQIRKEERTDASLRNTLKSKEDELASLRRSLQALSGPAQLNQPTPAVLTTSAGSGAPVEGDTGVFCKSIQAKAAQQGLIGSAVYQGSAPQYAAASASAQQPRPVISLVDTSLQQRSNTTFRQRINPQLDASQGSRLIQAGAGPQQDQGGIPEQASSGMALHSSRLTQGVLQAQPDRQTPGKGAWQQKPPPISGNEPSTRQRAQKALQKTLSAQPGARHMQMQASRSAGEVDRHTSRGTAEHLKPVAAVTALQQQHQGSAGQSDGAGHPALTPPLEIMPYTVQEPDSPPLQQAGAREGTSAMPQAQMPSTCIFMETTITRTITPGRTSARAESTWAVRKVHEAGGSAAHLEGFHTANRQQRDAPPFLDAPQSFRGSPAETGAGKQHHPRSESHFEPSRGGKEKAGGRGKQAKRPRKKLKRILGSDDEDSLALYQPEAADERFRKAQLEAEHDLLLSSLW